MIWRKCAAAVVRNRRTKINEKITLVCIAVYLPAVWFRCVNRAIDRFSIWKNIKEERQGLSRCFFSTTPNRSCETIRLGIEFNNGIFFFSLPGEISNNTGTPLDDGFKTPVWSIVCKYHWFFLKQTKKCTRTLNLPNNCRTWNHRCWHAHINEMYLDQDKS